MGEKANPVAYAERQSLRQNTLSVQRSTAVAVRNNIRCCPDKLYVLSGQTYYFSLLINA